MTDRHKEFAEAMRNIMRHNEEKEKKQRNVDNDFEKKTVPCRKFWKLSSMSFLEQHKSMKKIHN